MNKDPKEARTATSFELFTVGTKKALEYCTDHGAIAEFVTECMSYQRDHPELDMLIVYGIVLENYKASDKKSV